MSSNQTTEGENEPKYGPGGSVLLDGPEEAHRKQEAEQKSRQERREHLQLFFNGALSLTTVLLVIVGGYQACQSQRSADAATNAAEAAKRAANTASDTLTELKTGSGAIDTHTLAQQAITQATQTTNLADAASKQVIALSTQSSNTAKLATAATDQIAALQESNRLSADMLRNSQRPWVAIESAELNEPIYLDPGGGSHHVELSIHIRNTGTSVASEGLMFMVAYELSTPVDKLSSDWNKPCDLATKSRFPLGQNFVQNWPVGFLLVPGQSGIYRDGVSMVEVTEAKFMSGEFNLLGCATYKDQLGTLHESRFCFQPAGPITDISSAIFKVCEAFQSAN